MTIQTPSPFEAPAQVAFHRTELALILGLYGRMVAAGEWRDYGISNLRDIAVFSIFRRTAETRFTALKKIPACGCARGNMPLSGWMGRC